MCFKFTANKIINISANIPVEVTTMKVMKLKPRNSSGINKIKILDPVYK